MSVVDRIISEALASARSHEQDVRQFHRDERLRRMHVLVNDVAEWLEEGEDAHRLAALGVSWRQDGEGLFFEQASRAFVIAPRDDMTVSAGGTIIHANRDCPVLTRSLYATVMACVLHWAREGHVQVLRPHP